MAVADQPDIAALHERLRIQVVERAGDIGDAGIAVDDIAAAAHVLIAARAEAVRRQHDIAPARDQLAPGLRVPADAVAGMSEHDGWKRAGAARTVDLAGDLRTGRRGADSDARKARALGRGLDRQNEQQNRNEKTHGS